MTFSEEYMGVDEGRTRSIDIAFVGSQHGQSGRATFKGPFIDPMGITKNAPTLAIN